MSYRFSQQSAPTLRGKGIQPEVNESDITATASTDGRMAILLARYPELSHEELYEVRSFIRHARPTQVRRFPSSELVRGKLVYLMVEQGGMLRSRREAVTWTGFAIFAILLLCWLLWDMRPHPLSPPRQVVAAQAIGPGLVVVPGRGEARDDQSAPGKPK